MDRHMDNKKMDYRERCRGNKANKVSSITGNPQDSALKKMTVTGVHGVVS